MQHVPQALCSSHFLMCAPNVFGKGLAVLIFMEHYIDPAGIKLLSLATGT